MTELSVIDYYFVVHRPSDVALAAILNSIDAVEGSSESALILLQTELRRIRGGNHVMKPEVVDCRNRLQILYAQGGYSRSEVTAREPRHEAVSPVCVSFGVHLPEVQCNNETYEHQSQIDIDVVDSDIDIADITLHNLEFGLEVSQPSKENNPRQQL